MRLVKLGQLAADEARLRDQQAAQPPVDAEILAGHEGRPTVTQQDMRNGASRPLLDHGGEQGVGLGAP